MTLLLKQVLNHQNGPDHLTVLQNRDHKSEGQPEIALPINTAVEILRLVPEHVRAPHVPRQGF